MELTIEQQRAVAMARARARAAGEELTRREVGGMSDQQLRAASFEAPDPPPGVNIHTAGGGNMLSQGGGKLVPQSDVDARARAAREASGAAGMAADTGEAVLRGVPFAGPFLDRAGAALAPGDYAENLKGMQARSRTFDEDHPILSTGAKIGGAIGATVASAPVAAGSRVVGGLMGVGAKTLPGAIMRGGTAGLTQGIASGVGRSEDITNGNEVAGNVIPDAAFGAALGAGIPAAIGGTGMLIDALKNKGTDALSGLSRPSRGIVDQYLSDPARVQSQQSAAQALGPNGMLADVSPEWQMVARGSAARPGGRETVVDALNARDAGKNTRINATMDAELGKAPIPSKLDAGLRDAQKALSPEYKKALEGAKAVDTKPIADALDTIEIDERGAGQKVAAQIRDMLTLKGTKELDPNPATLLATRQAIDGMSGAEMDRNVQRILTTARQAIDAELAAKVPGLKAVDARYADLAKQREAVETGQTLFDTGRSNVVRPQELEETLSKAGVAGGQMVGPSAVPKRLAEGARAELDRIVGTNANDVAKLNQVLKSEGDWNRDKLRMLFGQDKADRVLKVLDAERQMEGTHRAVVGNSATASTLGFKEMLDDVAKGQKVGTDTTMTGFAARGVQKVANMLLKSNGEQKAETIAKELGRLSVATGSDMQAITAALLKKGVRKSQLQQVYDYAGKSSSAANPLVRALMERDGGDGRR